MGRSGYMLLNVFIIAIPLAFSFGPRLHFINNWKNILVGIVLGLIVFIPWDMGFTAMNIWNFNNEYLIGVFIGNIPLEEYLFFITVPYLFLFIHELIKYYIKRDILRGTHFSLTPAASIGLAWLLIMNFDRTYTAISTAFLILLLLIQLIKLNRFMSRFYLSIIAFIIPLFIINGIKTGLNMVSYNEVAILGIKLGTIPVENFIYQAGLVLLVTMGYEWSKRRFSTKSL